MYEAIAFVISAMPMEQAAQTLREFSLDILALVHATANKATIATKDELKAATGTFLIRLEAMRVLIRLSDGLENLEVMLSVIDTFGDDLPAACRNSCQEAWLFFDPFVAKYGTEYNTCERVTRVLRFALNFFGDMALPVIPSVLARMAAAFEASGFASYLWIIGKIVSRYGDEDDESLRAAFKQAYEQTSAKLLKMLSSTVPTQIPDGEPQTRKIRHQLTVESSHGGLSANAHRTRGACT